MNKENGGGQRVPVLRRDYTPPPFDIGSVALVFDLQEEYAEVHSRMSFRRLSGEAVDLVLDGGKEMELVSVRLDGSDIDSDRFERTGETLTVTGVPDEFQLEIVTRLRPQDNTRLEGLYKSGGMFCTQCEAEGFRHITFCLDRPDVMSVYSVRIEADKSLYPVLLSNGNPSSSGDLEEGRHFAEWDDPWPKPSYLFALVAGDLAAHSGSFRTAEGREVKLHIWVREADLDKCEHALQSLIKSMQWDEEVYGLAYDLDVYNIVAVSDFNMGAMENKGLNIFNTKYVLANTDTATDTDFDNVESVIGHEYFHNWTGNRVTCRDWFQLSLKEGLTVFRDQEFSADMGSRGIKRIDDVRMLRGAQFPEDAGPLAHPVRPDSYVEINNFYTATVYNKGAEVIRMMHLLIGAEAFRRGMDIYFERYDGQAVTCEDFVCAMEAGSGRDLGQFRRWYSQVGTPVVTVETALTEGVLDLEVGQHTAPTTGQETKLPLHVPLRLAIFDKDGAKIPGLTANDCVEEAPAGEYLLELREESASVRFQDIPEGATVSLMRGFSAPVVLKTAASREDQLKLIGADDDPFVKWDTVQTVAAELVFELADGGKAEEADGLIAALRKSITSDGQDPALRAEVASLPGINILIGMRDKIDLDQLYDGWRTLQSVVDKELSGEWAAIHDQYSGTAGTDLSPEAKASRRLANTALAAMARADSDGWEDLCLTQYQSADNMTDRLAALSAVVNSGSSHRSEMLTGFETNWQHDELVMDKWFMLQATADRADVLDDVERLARHPAFTLSNPNRARSLVAGFAMGNVAHFHHASGRGYDFLANMICQMDASNPQLAARLVPPLGRWKKFDQGRQAMMKAALRTIIDREDCSRDVAELANLAFQD